MISNVVNVEDVELQSQTISPASLIPGKMIPRVRHKILSEQVMMATTTSTKAQVDGSASSNSNGNNTIQQAAVIVRGVWEMSEGVLKDVEEDEMFVVIKGRATVLIENSPTMHLKAGSIGVFQRGNRSTWIVHDKLLKVYEMNKVMQSNL